MKLPCPIFICIYKLGIFFGVHFRDGFIAEYLTDTFNVQNFPENDNQIQKYSYMKT